MSASPQSKHIHSEGNNGVSLFGCSAAESIKSHASASAWSPGGASRGEIQTPQSVSPVCLPNRPEKSSGLTSRRHTTCRASMLPTTQQLSGWGGQPSLAPLLGRGSLCVRCLQFWGRAPATYSPQDGVHERGTSPLLEKGTTVLFRSGHLPAGHHTLDLAPLQRQAEHPLPRKGSEGIARDWPCGPGLLKPISCSLLLNLSSWEGLGVSPEPITRHLSQVRFPGDKPPV